MSVVLRGGEVRPGDSISVELPVPPHNPLIYRVPELEVRVSSIRREAEGIHSVEFQALDGGMLPPFTAGAHVDLKLSPEMTRSYSLSNDPHERNRYVVSVNKDLNSRGGSKHVHEELLVSDRVTISPPRNNFSLDETAEHTVFIGGGIGVTPLKAMIARLERVGRSWQLFYATRNREATAFLNELGDLEEAIPGRITLQFSAETNGTRLDLEAIVTNAPASTHFYCCGPQSMIAAFEAAAAKLPKSQVHVEHFAAKGETATDGGFELRLQRSHRSLQVRRGSTILDTLLRANIEVPYSCKEGVCGTCQVKVVEGLPDHRDQVLSEAEHNCNDKMMVCCSGSRTALLVLDL